jgi:hypothetical protein
MVWILQKNYLFEFIFILISWSLLIRIGATCLSMTRLISLGSRYIYFNYKFYGREVVHFFGYVSTFFANICMTKSDNNFTIPIHMPHTN